jgi:hypothetical protein
MCICVFTNKTTFRTKQIHIRRCAKEKTFAETEKGHLCICVSVFSQQNHSLIVVKSVIVEFTSEVSDA